MLLISVRSLILDISAENEADEDEHRRGGREPVFDFSNLKEDDIEAMDKIIGMPSQRERESPVYGDGI